MPKSIDVEVGSVKSLSANYLNQLDVGEATFEGGEEASATKKKTVDMTKDKRTSFGLHDLPSDAPSDDPEHDDLTSVTPSEMGHFYNFHHHLNKFKNVKPLVIPWLDQYKRRETVMLRRKTEDVKDMCGWNNFVQPERQK